MPTSIVRVTSRCLLLMSFVLAPLLLRGAGVRAREVFGDRHPRQLRGGFLAGVAIGFASFVPHLALLLAAGARVVTGSAAQASLAILEALPATLGAALLVALVEEMLFRGVVFSAVRTAGAGVAITVSALLYALAHFLRPAPGAEFADAVDWHSGFMVLGAGLARFADPATLAGDFLALFAAGLAFGLIRERSGQLATTIGIHAAWIVGIKLTRAASDLAPVDAQAWLVGDFDGVIGYLAAGWFLLVTLLLVKAAPRSSSIR
jgi:membrane protease YdiL (CAAX protease family)